MEYLIDKDIESVLEILEMTMEELADELGVSRMSMNNWIKNKSKPSEKHQKEFYEYVFWKGVRLNKIKEQFYREDYINTGEVLLFHGAKTYIDGGINLEKSKTINDFGKGFYCGESLEQSAMFVATHPKSSLYMLKFKHGNLKKKVYKVDREWMLTIAYFRGRLGEYENSELVRKIKALNKGIDYIIAPIADNRMFEILDSFIDGEITDVQCRHCLSATNLGNQYVFISQKALNNVTILERCFLADSEKELYLNVRRDGFNMNRDKVKLARKQFRNQGEYIEDILL